MRVFTIPFIVLFIIVIACHESPKEENKFEKSNQITLIISHPSKNNKHTFSSGAWTVTDELHEIEYYDDNLIKQLILFDYEKASDTLVIKTNHKTLEITHVYKAIEKLSYTFQNGDTVLFTYNGTKPFAMVLNRQTNEVETNYDLLKIERIDKGEFSPYAKCKNPFWFNNFNFKAKDFGNEVQRVKIEIWKEGQINVKKESIFLDSLHENNLISEAGYKFYKTKIEYTLRNIEVRNEDSHFNIEQAISSSDKFLLTPQDSLLQNVFYRDLLETVYFTKFYPKVKRVVKNHKGGGSNLPDFTALYDTINSRPGLGRMTRNIFLLKTMESIIKDRPIAEWRKYFEKFKADVTDTTFVQYLTKKYNIEDANTNDLMLSTVSNKQISLAQIIKKHKGKVLYIDFWASWCPPCIEALPDLEKLKTSYKNKSVIFLQVSLEDNIFLWKKAHTKFKCIDSLSFLITNRNTSQFIDKYKLQTIPRYMIVNKNGKIEEKDAPKPSDKKANLLINKYLKDII